MVHRTLLGSMERFFGVLLEHYAGALPVWLSPVQVQLVPISDDQLDYSHEVVNELEEAGFRAEVYDRPGRQLNAKIRDGQLAKIPYLAVVGRREAESGSVNLRDTRSGAQQALSRQQLLERLRQETGPS
jgi:threonyl-tRNA synthetase